MCVGGQDRGGEMGRGERGGRGEGGVEGGVEEVTGRSGEQLN